MLSSCDLCVGNCHLRRKSGGGKVRMQCNSNHPSLHWLRTSQAFFFCGCTLEQWLTLWPKGSSINVVTIFLRVGRQCLCDATSKTGSTPSSSMWFLLNFGHCIIFLKLNAMTLKFLYFCYQNAKIFDTKSKTFRSSCILHLYYLYYTVNKYR